MAIAAAPLIHIYLPKKNPDVVAYSKKLDADIEVFDVQIQELRTKYDKGVITAQKYIQQNDQLIKEKNDQVDINDKLYDEKVDSTRIFGFKTLRVFLIALGVRIVYLFLSIAITIIVVLLVKPEKGLLKNSLIAFQVFCYSISLYELTWVFWDGQDYPIITYWWAILTVTTVVSLALVLFLTWYEFKIERLEGIARNLIRFTFNIELEEGFIKPEKLNRFKKKRTLLIKDSLDNE